MATELAEAVANVVEEPNNITPDQMTTEDLKKAISELPVEGDAEKPPEPVKPVVLEKPPVPAVDDEKVKFVQEIEKLKRQTKEQDSLIRRQSAEVGAVRKLAEKLGLTESHKIDPERFQENAEGYIQKAVDQRLAMEKLKQAQDELAVDENKVRIQNRIPDVEEYVEDMAAAAKTLGIPDSAIAGFKAEWWKEDVNTLMPLYLAAKKNREAVGYMERLKVLEAENATLKKRPAEMVKRIAANASEEATLTASSGTSSSERAPLTDAEIARMPVKELKTYLAEVRRKGGF